VLSIRPERWSTGAPTADPRGLLKGRLIESVYAGAVLRQVVELPGRTRVVVARAGAGAAPAAGAQMEIGVAPEDVVVLPVEADC
jgi:ABC-type Fe3+/spermidine/putrescine transport system ATPase subunit